MMSCSVRSAKSVAMDQGKVVGVNNRRFARRVVFLTRTTVPLKTGIPSDLSHYKKKASCVDFPLPSVPSTIKACRGGCASQTKP